MKTLGFVIRFLFALIGIVISSAIATFFLSIFKLQDVQNAIEFFKNLL